MTHGIWRLIPQVLFLLVRKICHAFYAVIQRLAVNGPLGYYKKQ